MYFVCVCILKKKSGKFRTFIIILLLFIRGEKKCEREGRTRKKEKKMRCAHVRERKRVVVMLSLIKWVSYFFKYLQKCH